MPSAGQDGAGQVEVGVVRVGRVRGQHQRGDEGDDGQHRGRDERRLPAPELEQAAGAEHADDGTGHRERRTRCRPPWPRWLAGNTAVIVDRVPGMIIAAPTPITTRQAMRNAVEVANDSGEGGEPEHDGADQQHVAPPQPVAERTQGQHEGGEGDGVAVGDPGQRRARRRQVDGQLRHRHVQR